MKKHLIVTIVALATSTGMAFAGSDGNKYITSSSSSSAGASAASDAVALSQSQGGNVTINNPGNLNTRTHSTFGTQTIRSAPQVVAPSMSSGHPCAFAPVSVGVSVVGFGGAFGGQRIDDACLLAQMGVQDASISMIAARNPAACRALAAVGRIAPNACGGRRAAAAPVYRTAVAARPVARQQVRRASLPAQVVLAPAPRVKFAKAKPAYRQVKQLKQMGKNCQTVFATASTKKTVCG
jgi:hypothetical protein